jgi:hypothetical protein
MTNLGIMASQISGHLYDGPYGAYDSLATVTLSASTASITFAGIPTGYKHLQVRSISYASNGSYLRTQFNGDTAANYSWHLVSGQGSSAFTDVGTSDTSMAGPSQANSANIFCASIMDVLDYANTNKYKTARYLGGKDQNGSGNIALHSGSWRNTAAVTSITFFSSGVDFPIYTQFALYGVK